MCCTSIDTGPPCLRQEGGCSDYGVNFNYGADFTCSKPLVGSLVLDAGTVGDAGLFHVRATMGVILQRWELFGGYDFYRIGSTNLQGPLAGLRNCA